MANNEGQEKTEQPTSKKLEDQRQEGKVAKSQEISSFAVFGSGLIILFLSRNFVGNQLSDLSKYVFNSLDTLQLTSSLLQLYFAKMMLYFFITISPILLGIVLVSFAANVSQVGFRITVKALKPKFEKLNPLNGIKKIFFSTQSLVEVLKTLFKVMLIGGFTYFILETLVVDSISLVNLTVFEILNNLIESALQLVWKVALVYAVLAAADFVWTRYKYKKDNMMTKQEVKEEHKQVEGDPMVKGKIKGMQLEMARRRMMQDIPTADVVITNPTHFAIAIKYEPQKHHAPKVVAKGVDELAQRIKKIAAENNVPMHEDRELARALYKMCDVGDFIPEKLFHAVAKILAYIFNLRNSKKRKIV
ncbi:MAG: flagellar biosynthesis protein FlhB [Melioribacteraceae bacterium]|nr:flagellar biosynthesis protein FlhB [Melioribacteraceae bacterium]